jgi:hypothetical protein
VSQENMDTGQLKIAAKRTGKAALEQKFLDHWQLLFPTLPKPELQWHFHSERKWRFDFAWVPELLAVELQGGSFVRGGHNRGVQQAKDYEKQREAVRLGWRVLPFNSLDMHDPVAVVEFVAALLTNAKETA